MKTVSVTQEDIDNGIRCHAEKCPVAIATARALGVRVEVCQPFICVGFNRMGSINVETPIDARRFIRDYDQGADVHPFTFIIGIADDKASR